ncbi:MULTISPECIES: hypothetical protein [unclassified Microcoleus]|nr:MULTISPECIES: hypothetical protein [unclassified Microcoleus]
MQQTPQQPKFWLLRGFTLLLTFSSTTTIDRQRLNFSGENLPFNE